jgi:hypothetical protein
MVLFDKERCLQASRQAGKGILLLVKGFVGGVAHSLKPAALKSQKETKKPAKQVRHKKVSEQ